MPGLDTCSLFLGNTLPSNSHIIGSFSPGRCQLKCLQVQLKKKRGLFQLPNLKLPSNYYQRTLFCFLYNMYAYLILSGFFFIVCLLFLVCKIYVHRDFICLTHHWIPSTKNSTWHIDGVEWFLRFLPGATFCIMLKSTATHSTSPFTQSTATNSKIRQTRCCVAWGSYSGTFPVALPWIRGSGASIWNSP